MTVAQLGHFARRPACLSLLPAFENLLLRTPEEQRVGWIFNPRSLDGRAGRKVRKPRVGWVGKVISDIREEFEIVVNAEGKFGSAHDLRRTCADRLIDAGVAERGVQEVLRHASGETTRRYYIARDVQRSAREIRESLSANRT